MTHFTPQKTTILYRSEELSADGGEMNTDFEEELLSTERLGFSSVEQYNELREASLTTEVLGEYKYTLRVFENGFVSRIVVGGGDGLLLTSDTVDVERIGELATVVRQFFESAAT